MKTAPAAGLPPLASSSGPGTHCQRDAAHADAGEGAACRFQDSRERTRDHLGPPTVPCGRVVYVRRLKDGGPSPRYDAVWIKAEVGSCAPAAEADALSAGQRCCACWATLLLPQCLSCPACTPCPMSRGPALMPPVRSAVPAQGAFSQGTAPMRRTSWRRACSYRAGCSRTTCSARSSMGWTGRSRAAQTLHQAVGRRQAPTTPPRPQCAQIASCPWPKRAGNAVRLCVRRITALLGRARADSGALGRTNSSRTPSRRRASGSGTQARPSSRGARTRPTWPW